MNETYACPANGSKGNNYGQEQTFDVMTPPSIFPSIPQPTGHQRPANSNETQAQSFAVVRPKVGDEPSTEEVGNVSIAFSFFMPIVLVSLLAFWVLYAYRNPHTKSGQLLIQVSWEAAMGDIVLIYRTVMVANDLF